MQSKNKSQIIIFPGLGDGIRPVEKLTRFWKKYGVEVHVFRIGWRDDGTLEDKVNDAVTFIKK